MILQLEQLGLLAVKIGAGFAFWALASHLGH